MKIYLATSDDFQERKRIMKEHGFVLKSYYYTNSKEIRGLFKIRDENISCGNRDSD